MVVIVDGWSAICRLKKGLRKNGDCWVLVGQATKTFKRKERKDQEATPEYRVPSPEQKAHHTSPKKAEWHMVNGGLRRNAFRGCGLMRADKGSFDSVRLCLSSLRDPASFGGRGRPLLHLKQGQQTPNKTGRSQTGCSKT